MQALDMHRLFAGGSHPGGILSKLGDDEAELASTLGRMTRGALDPMIDTRLSCWVLSLGRVYPSSSPTVVGARTSVKTEMRREQWRSGAQFFRSVFLRGGCGCL